MILHDSWYYRGFRIEKQVMRDIQQIDKDLENQYERMLNFSLQEKWNNRRTLNMEWSGKMTYHLICIFNASGSECDHPQITWLYLSKSFRKTLIPEEETDETAAYKKPLIQSTFRNHISQNSPIILFLK